MEKPTKEEVGRVIKSWENVIRHFQDLFKAKGPSYLDFIDGVWLWGLRFTEDNRDCAISATMVKDLGPLRDAYLEQMEELKEWERKCKELCQAHGIALIQLHDLQAENQALKAKLLK